jgi:hypothetical protein
MENELEDSNASGVNDNIEDYLNDHFGKKADKPSDIDAYLNDRFR